MPRTVLPPDQWRKIITRFRLSGLNQARFCQSEPFSVSTLQAWIRRLGPDGSDPWPKPTAAPFVELPATAPVQAGNAGTFILRLDLGDGLSLELTRRPEN